MDQENTILNQLSRRRRDARAEAIRQAVDVRSAAFAEAAGPLPDREKIVRDSVVRVLRAKGANGVESR